MNETTSTPIPHRPRPAFDLGPGRRRAVTLLIVLLTQLPGLSGAEAPEPMAARAHYDLDGALALQGYDPVAYFTEGRARPGKPSVATDFEGVTYRFASAANRDRFLEDPDRYRPAYGGWCAWAMVQGGKTSPDPTHFIILGPGDVVQAVGNGHLPAELIVAILGDQVVLLLIVGVGHGVMFILDGLC